MLSLVYVSFATEPFSDAQLDALLEKSRRNNTRDGLSGMLLYRDGDFLQVLEGPEDKVREAYARIARDSRHGGIMLLDESQISERAFTDWSMGFRRLRRNELPEGFVDFFNRNFDPAQLKARGSEAYQYLLGFRNIAA